jgi:hypothetical protein
MMNSNSIMKLVISYPKLAKTFQPSDVPLDFGSYHTLALRTQMLPSFIISSLLCSEMEVLLKKMSSMVVETHSMYFKLCTIALLAFSSIEPRRPPHNSDTARPETSD